MRNIITKGTVVVKLEPEPLSTGKPTQITWNKSIKFSSSLKVVLGFLIHCGLEEKGPTMSWLWTISAHSWMSCLKCFSMVHFNFTMLLSWDCRWQVSSTALCIYKTSHPNSDILTQIYSLQQLYSPWHQAMKPAHGSQWLEGYGLCYQFWYCKAISESIILHSYFFWINVRRGEICWYTSFWSLNSHLGSELNQRDNLEALAYTLLFLCGGSLPCMVEPTKRLEESKSFIKAIALCSAIYIAKEAFKIGNHFKMPKELQY